MDALSPVFRGDWPEQTWVATLSQAAGALPGGGRVDGFHCCIEA